MTLSDPEVLDRLSGHLVAALGAEDVRLETPKKLSGGAIQENWAVDADIDGGPRAGRHQWVLRTDAPSGVAVSLSRAEEFQLLQAAHEMGATVPEPVHLCIDGNVIDKPFVIMARVAGTALGSRIVRGKAYDGDMEELTRRMGRELATIHRITPDSHRFDFLPEPAAFPAAAEITRMATWLGEFEDRHPVLDWATTWLEQKARAMGAAGGGTPVLAHHDFRTGNYMIDREQGLTGILDWEFAGWSERTEDLGWFCATCWRFGNRRNTAGGIGLRETFVAAYEAESGVEIDPERLHFWEVYAHYRWAVIALQQARRFTHGGEDNLELALTGRMLPEMELEILLMTAPEGCQAVDPAIGLERMIRDAPDMEALLGIAVKTLKNDVLPHIDPAAKLPLLMSLNALGMIERELSRPGISSEDRAAKAGQSPRGGGIQGEETAATQWKKMMADVKARLTISNPRYLESALETGPL